MPRGLCGVRARREGRRKEVRLRGVYVAAEAAPWRAGATHKDGLRTTARLAKLCHAYGVRGAADILQAFNLNPHPLQKGRTQRVDWIRTKAPVSGRVCLV